MYLDQRGYSIIQEIANHPSITGKELEKTLGLTRKQISYSLGKINDYLEENGFDTIKWLKTGRFLISLSVIREFQSGEENIPGFTYICSDEERVSWIFLRLLCHEEELSTYHFIDELKISKNTLMGDLKRLQEKFAQYHLKLQYDRKKGYQLLGNEYEKRSLLIQVLRQILEMPGGEEQLCRIYKIRREDLEQRREDIRMIEEKLQVRFTDERLKELPYILSFVFLQIRNRCTLDQLPESCRQVVGTKEYAVMASFCSRYGVDDEREKIFLTVQIQISNIHSLEEEGETRENLMQAAETIIKTFERVSCVKIVEKEGLLEALVQHLGPALYRIRYRYHVQPDITDMILPRYQYLHEMLKLSVDSLELMLQCAIPDSELIYLTALFGAWLRREGTLEHVWPRKKAVIVCSNGTTVSNFLHVTLKEMFPEIDFIACLSARGFKEYHEDFQIVFTTIRLETDKKQFVVKTGFDEYTRKVFRKKVREELEGIGYKTITVEGIMELVDMYSVVQDRDRLVKGLSQYLNPVREQGDRIQEASGELFLTDLLPDQNIVFLKECLSWEAAVRKAALPLLENNRIEARYVEKMIQLITEEKPYIMLADGVIVAHAGVEDGVRKPGMSLLRLPERISINGYMEADIIIVLATPDKTVHLTALYQLLHLLEEKRHLDQIRTAGREPEVGKIIWEECSIKR